ncbi:hypothetical protein ACA910_003966 [Epithemia clementina (nom. ined.)]
MPLLRNNNIRVLCLHEEESNGLKLKMELRKLGERLYVEHRIDLVYVNAPLVVKGIDVVTPIEGVDAANEETYGQRIWWDKESLVPTAPMTAQSLYDDDDDNDPFLSSDGGVHQRLGASETNEERHRESESIPGKNSLSSSSSSTATSNSKDYVGLDASLLLLKQVWRSSSAIGILGIGQGASIGALLTLILEQEARSTGKTLPPQFGVFVNARSSLLPNDFPEDSIPFLNHRGQQFLHLYSEQSSDPNGESRACEPKRNTNKDTHAVNAREEAWLLHRQFGGEWHEHSSPSSASSPLRSSSHENARRNEEMLKRPSWKPNNIDLNRIGRFLVTQKNLLGQVETTSNLNEYANLEQQLEYQESAALVALQQELHLTEEKASSLIAKEIAAHPPKALMAVIQPSQVSGRPWDTMDRPPGGGAPCPSEFLLHREKRDASSNTGGPSRVHPKENGKEDS